MVNKKLLGGLSALAAAGIAGGIYLASPASAGSPQSSASPSAHAKKHKLRLRGVHGQATVRRGSGFGLFDWQRGTLTANKSGTLTVRSADGATWQWRTNQNTRVRKNGQKTSLGKLANGDFVYVAGPDNSGNRTARAVVVPRKAKASPSPS